MGFIVNLYLSDQPFWSFRIAAGILFCKGQAIQPYFIPHSVSLPHCKASPLFKFSHNFLVCPGYDSGSSDFQCGYEYLYLYWYLSWGEGFGTVLWGILPEVPVTGSENNSLHQISGGYVPGLIYNYTKWVMKRRWKSLIYRCHTKDDFQFTVKIIMQFY